MIKKITLVFFFLTLVFFMVVKEQVQAYDGGTSITMVKDADPADGTDFTFSTPAGLSPPTYLLQWGSSGSGNGQFDVPYSVAVDGAGNIYVTEGSSRIQKFDSNGNYLLQWGSLGSGNGQFNAPYAVAVDGEGDVYVADTFNHRIQKFDSNGNYLLQWGSAGNGNGQFFTPYALTLDGAGDVYVTDSFNNRVQKFDSSGNYLLQWGSFGSGNGQFNTVYGVAVDGAGDIYVSEANNRIQKFDNSGSYLLQWGSSGSGNGQFNDPFGLAVDGAGYVYVTDTYNDRIQKFDRSGSYLLQWGSSGSGNGQFDTPFGLAIAESGDVYVADILNERIQKFSTSQFTLDDAVPDDGDGIVDSLTFPGLAAGSYSFTETLPLDWQLTGLSCDSGSWNADLANAALTVNLGVGQNITCTFSNTQASSITIVKYADPADGTNFTFTNNLDPTYLLQWGSLGSGNGQFNMPFGVAVDGAGDVYVVDTNNHRIQKFDSSGNYLLQWGSLGSGNGQFDSPTGVAIDGAGDVYVSDAVNPRVQKFDSSGNYLLQWGSLGSGNGQFDSPRGLAVDGAGDVYVTDSSNNRIQKFDSSGNYLLQWGSLGSGNGQFKVPLGVAVDGSRAVYVADTSNFRVQKFDSSGNYLSQWGSLGSGNGQFLAPRGVVVDGAGDVYVADAVNPRIQKFDSSGNYLSQWASNGSGNGQFSFPHGVAVDGTGAVYVADTFNNRIQKFNTSQFALDNAVPDDGDGILDSLTLPGLTAGSYSFTETLPLDWQLTGLNCDSGSWNADLANAALTVNLSVGQNITCTFSNGRVPVLNNLTISSPLNENDLATLSGDIDDGSVIDTYTMTVDWGDGTPVEQFNYGAGITAFNETHQYLDDDPTGTVSDLYSATVTITDSTNLIDSGLLGVTVNNVAPQLTNLLATPLVISETDTITLTGVISDPGTLDTFSLTIDWQDGSVENFNYPAGTTNFLVTHSYQDDALLAFAPLADFTIDLTIADDDSGSRSTSLLVMVNNVAPELLGVTATSIPENDSTLLSGLINEVSPLDTFTLTVDWGDGTALESFNYPAGTTIFSETHPYLDDDPTGTPADLYTVTLMLEDDNGGVDILQTTLTVSNVAPVVDAGPDQAVLRGAPLSFSGTFSDVGILDTHTILWGFGDGGTSTGTLTPIYTYTEGGTYTVTLTVTDDDTGVGTDTLVVTVEMPTSVGLSGVGGQSSRSLSVTGPLLLVLAFSMFLLRRRYLATGYWPRNRLPSIGQ